MVHDITCRNAPQLARTTRSKVLQYVHVASKTLHAGKIKITVTRKNVPPYTSPMKSSRETKNRTVSSATFTDTTDKANKTSIALLRALPKRDDNIHVAH
jgi:hypothetical protein